MSQLLLNAKLPLVANHPCLLAQPQDLNKQTLERIEVAVTEVAGPAVDCLLMLSED